MKRGKGLKRTGIRRKPKQRKLNAAPPKLSRAIVRQINPGHSRFRDLVLAKSRRCAFPGCCAPSTDPHHVVYRSKLAQERKDEWDPDDGLPLCHHHHHEQHYGNVRVPAAALRVENLAFAFRALGPHAYDYIRRRYYGPDPRLEAHLALAEAASEASDSKRA